MGRFVAYNDKTGPHFSTQKIQGQWGLYHMITTFASQFTEAGEGDISAWYNIER